MQQVQGKSFAEALKEHGLKHYFLGSLVGDIGSAIGSVGSAIGSAGSSIGSAMGSAFGGIGSLVGGPLGGLYNGLMGGINASPNQFSADPYGMQFNQAPIQTSDYGSMMSNAASQQQGGYDRSLQYLQNQQNLEKILQDQYTGGSGPSVAQTMLNKATGQNVQTQGALMAGSRGGGTNVGLLARQAAQTGGDLQQKAAQDSATLRAQEQTALREALQNQQALMSQSNLEQEGLSGRMYGAASEGQNAQNRSILDNYLTPQQWMAENYRNANNINADVAKQNAQATNDLRMGLINAIGGMGQSFAGGGGGGGGGAATRYKGGEVPHHIKGVASVMYPEHFYQGTGRVPGQVIQPGVDKPSYDKVPILAEPGEVVLPKHIAQAPDAANKAKEFMQHLIDKQQGRGYERIASSKKRRK